MRLLFLREDGRWLPQLTIIFKPFGYRLYKCQDQAVDFDNEPQLSEDGSIWEISKSKESLTIRCNGMRLATYRFSSSLLNESCVTKWGGDVVDQVSFRTNVSYNADTASDFYRAGFTAGNVQ